MTFGLAACLYLMATAAPLGSAGLFKERRSESVSEIDSQTEGFVEEAYHEASGEALHRGESKLTAHKEGVVAAAMLLAAMSGMEDEPARQAVVALDLRPAAEA